MRLRRVRGGMNTVRGLRLSIVCIVSVAMVLSSAVVALAATDSGSVGVGSNPQGVARGNGTPPVITKYVVSEVLPDGTETVVYFGRTLGGFDPEPDIVTLAATGYKTVTYKITTYGVLGRLYAMYNKLSWRWDGYRCYLVSRSGWGVTYAGGWSYSGLVENTWYGTGTNYITSKYRGKFHFAAGWFYYDMYSGIRVEGWNGGSSRCFAY